LKEGCLKKKDQSIFNQSINQSTVFIEEFYFPPQQQQQQQQHNTTQHNSD
tara:strand:+ start:91 stop:240 length:150 start_codon:yes stop_codon:yes gene_type:complete